MVAERQLVFRVYQIRTTNPRKDSRMRGLPLIAETLISCNLPKVILYG